MTRQHSATYRRKRLHLHLAAGGLIAATLSAPVHAETEDADQRQEIVVIARGEHRIGDVVAASEGAVASGDLANRPLLRPAELLEAVPGLIATQHSGGGKANQYFLRGFNLDHGTDFALSIDAMPINFRTHGHGQGYLDVGGLIPETVERIEYRKGPYRAEDGDFAFVGSARMTTKDRLDPFAMIEVGGFGYRRLVAGGSMPVGNGQLLFVGQAKSYDGPWELPEDLKSYSGLLKYGVNTPIGNIRLSASAYHATWNPTEQIPERAIGTLLADAYATLDPYLTGRSDRQSVNFSIDGAADWRLTMWAQHYDWSLFSNFTYFLNDPVNGDELRQYEKMWGYGGRIDKRFSLGSNVKLQIGAEGRGDDISQVGLDHSVAGVVDFARSRFAVNELSTALFGELQWKPTPRVMLTGGMRADFYRFSSRALAGSAWSGLVKDSIYSPRLGANVEIADGLAVYVNYGQGFHSNDARGVTSPSDPAPGLVKGSFRELGVRFERGSLVVTANHWWSRIASELIYVGDSGAVQPSGAGSRRGYEITAWWKPSRWLTIDAVWTGATSRYVDLPEGANHIPGALRNSGELGIATHFNRFNASVRVRHLGPHALIADDSAQGSATTLVNGRVAFTSGKLTLSIELLNALNAHAHDVDYFYATRLPGEPLGGVAGYNIKITEPRQIRLGVKVGL
ncbi:MAG: TonB-dependent receptor [Novosphingobium sp.]